MELQNGLCQSMEKKVDGIQNNSDIENDRAALYERMNSDNEEDFETTSEVGDEGKDCDMGVVAAAENIVVAPAVSRPIDVSPFMRNLDLDAMHALKLSEYANIGVEILSTESSGLECNISVVVAIKRYTISREVDYNVYEFEPQTFYEKCKTYGHGYNGRHTCTMGTILQDHFKLDSDTIAEAIRPLTASNTPTPFCCSSSRMRKNLCNACWIRRQRTYCVLPGNCHAAELATSPCHMRVVRKLPCR
ncbi:hypothetical protein Ahy_A09g042620 [Arachis hypogaea]|uniref:Uncharacterized protein n=1 Tax=Arachis hypogaea TaxID=3818 RepID=A0A445BGC8_ARAHY|nr:hypothetical protein Ahy_A09g042620 [Arachis hypogaea]